MNIQKIQELDAPRDESYKTGCPVLWEDVPPFSQLFPAGRSPSPLIKYGVLNLLYAYAYGVRFLYGDHADSLEFVDIVECLVGTKGSLAAGANYDLADTAVEAAASAVNNYAHIAVSLGKTNNFTLDEKKVYEKIN